MAQTKHIVAIYMLMVLSIALNIIPSDIMQMSGIFLFLAAFIAAYYYRHQYHDQIFIYSHTHYLICSVWISSLLLFAGMVGAFFFANHAMIENALLAVQQGIIYSKEQLITLLEAYAHTNILVFSLTLAPSLLYLLYRLGKGFFIACRGQPIENLKSWC